MTTDGYEPGTAGIEGGVRRRPDPDPWGAVLRLSLGLPSRSKAAPAGRFLSAFGSGGVLSSHPRRGFQGAEFLPLATPASNVGHRKISAPPVPEHVDAGYAGVVTDLTRNLAEWTDPAVLTLAPDAASLLLDIECRIEPQLATADWDPIRDRAITFTVAPTS